MPEGNILDRLEYYKNYLEEDKEIALKKYLPSSVDRDFPTLSSLVLQQENAPYSRVKITARDTQPTPSCRRKKDLFQPSKSSRTNDNAARSVQVGSHDTWESLSQRLFENSNDLEKVRSAFVFTCAQGSKSLPRQDRESSEYRTVRERNFAEIFENLVRAGGVPIENIEGFKKSADTEAGYEVPGGKNPWHACFVDGEWRLVDVHWAAESICGYRSRKFLPVNSNGSVPQMQAVPPPTQKFDCNEFFFLTDPEKLIVSHFPKDQRWQLLAKPITKEQFEQMPNYFAGSEQAMWLCWQVEPLNYVKNVILAGEEGRVEILFRVPNDERLGELQFDAEVYIASKSVGEAETKQRLAPDELMTSCERLGSASDIVRIVFQPPCAGKFELVVRLKDNEPARGFARLLTYIVHCPVNFLQQPQPDTATTEPAVKIDVLQPPPIEKKNYTPVKSSPQISEQKDGHGRHRKKTVTLVTPAPLPPTSWAPKFPMQNLTRESLAQLRSYQKPPTWEFNAVKAALLMLGFYEGRSEKWIRCQPLISAIPQAANDLIISSVHPQIAARCLEIIMSESGTPNPRNEADDKAAYAFREWVASNANAIKDATPPDEFKAANKEQQVKLFGITPEELAHWDWEDNLAKTEVARMFICFCDHCHVAIYNNDLRMHLHCNLSRENSSLRNTPRV